MPRSLEIADERPWSLILTTSAGGELWQGGSITAVTDTDGFDLVVTVSESVGRALPPPSGTRRVDWYFDDAHMPPVEPLLATAQTVRGQVDAGGKVLVRCAAGLNRSGLVVATVLVSGGWSGRDAIGRVRCRRRGALDNPSFARWLAEDAVADLGVRGVFGLD